MSEDLWSQVLGRLEREMDADDLHMWIKPVQCEVGADGLTLFAPNAIVQQTIDTRFRSLIESIVRQIADSSWTVRLRVGSTFDGEAQSADESRPAQTVAQRSGMAIGLDKHYQFENFVQGKSNQLARAAALQVAENPGSPDYNPLLLYGGTGLGKTHLLHAVGNEIRSRNAQSVVVYLHSEQFVSQMIMALRHNTIDQFKERYRSVNMLLIDDIQFFANKDRSQEELFHTFNSLLEGRQQIILTCDRYPKEVTGLEARLKSRFGWGLTVPVEPPDFETRVAILMSKAADRGTDMEEHVAHYIARRIRSNVRELEGALNTLCANARFTGSDLSLEFAKETLRDMLTVQERLITVAYIQKTVADYYKLRLADLLSKRRTRSIARPRQVAMALAKELTDHSLPEIGDAFGGRDHTTVLHACRKVEELRQTDGRLQDDFDRLVRVLTT